MIDINKIHHMDCFDGLSLISDKMVDLVLTDPPYKVKLKDSIDLKNRKAVYKDFEQMGWDDINIKDLYERLFPHFDRIVKKDGSVLIFCRLEWITYVIESAIKNNFDVKSTIIWHKTNPVPQIRKRSYLSACEAVIWLARWDKDKCLFKFNFKTQKEMHNFFEFPICQSPERTQHPTQKPLKIIYNLLCIHSDKGDTIIDPFSGSGTTPVACKILDRNFICFEKNEDYVNISNKRLRNIEKEEGYLGKTVINKDSKIDVSTDMWL